MDASIVELDLHGKTGYQAKVLIDSRLRRCAGVYRLRLIHGHNRGTQLRDMIYREYAAHPKVLQLLEINSGTTDLVLKQF